MAIIGVALLWWSLMSVSDGYTPIRGNKGKVLVSYSYFEKDDIQTRNFDFFITTAMGVDNVLDKPHNIDFVVVQSGDACEPCKRLLQSMKAADNALSEVRQVYESVSGPGRVTLLQRKENEGMDFAAHNITLEYLLAQGRLKQYKYVILLNSSVRGPFVPSYMPEGWQWPQAYTSRLVGDVHVVSSSLVCLPEVDLGGHGPKLESWAAAVDQEGLRVLMDEGVFAIRTCKLCKDGIVVKGEYGLSAAMTKHGYTFDTLMSKYRKARATLGLLCEWKEGFLPARDGHGCVDWRDRANWNCNNNVHPSRHGTYDGLSMHPFETVFVKASWHVGGPFVDKYAEWMTAQALGNPTTRGAFDEPMYRYAVSMEAQKDPHVEQCYKVLDRDKGQ
ncbi:hypothetical protein F751_3410 [Auxenochlorella protothecoides]|uniref:Uncharacterized protein n=1 Tax=Auxenochlorella protothecoides TaxID=3075 RepID=A0A087SBW5_AUXPR|nr:hypothetical protein F751_3410 [Auxenochlorella protothecoides]KFM23219.1 hypothetical protein F751_3410 [Auxenochlorella protothecoides]RMZ53579.1 hypothetical protein APUTEX25_003401 [Auxenochlorella protothecoides]|eukprot:RMZ53579.1 hypothetical protein APUTEX25_003401 [Auxenochlorella protothecoides]